MPRAIRKLIQSLLFLAVLTTACSRQGSEFVGKWVNTTDPCNKIEITRNGEQFLIGKAPDIHPATYKDGTLQVPTALGAIPVAYIQSSDTLVAGDDHYKRDHSSESPTSSSEFVGKWAGPMGLTMNITRNGEQFLMFYTVPGFGWAKPLTGQYTLTYKDGALRSYGLIPVGDPRFPPTVTLTYVSCSERLLLGGNGGNEFKRVK